MYSRVPRERPRQYSNGLRTETQNIFLKDLNYTFVALKTLGSVAKIQGRSGNRKNTYQFWPDLKCVCFE